MHIGMYETALSRTYIVVGVGVSAATGRISSIALQNRHGKIKGALLNMHHTRNPGRIVGTVRFKFTASERLLQAQPLFQSLINGIRLISISNNRILSQHPHRRIYDQTGILQLGRVKGLGPDAFSFRHKDTVAAVRAPSHNKVCGHGVFSVPGTAYNDPSPGICIAFQLLLQLQHASPPSRKNTCIMPKTPRGTTPRKVTLFIYTIVGRFLGDMNIMRMTLFQ